MGHTPGPWEISKKFICHSCISSINGLLIAQTSCVHDDRQREVQRANARLIAAAPDLLEACKMVLIAHPENIAAKRAVAKAEGR